VLPSLVRKAHEAKARGDARLMMAAPGRRSASSCTSTTPPTPGLPDEDYSSDSQINVGSGED